MKVLLVAVNAKYIHSNLAVYSIKAYAKKYIDHIVLKEFTINNSTEDILRGIYKEEADVVAFSCYIWNISIIAEIIEDMKKIKPDVKIWFGGPEVSYDLDSCFERYQELDGIMIGEGEQTFLEVMEYYIDQKRELGSVAGIAYRPTALINTESANTSSITVTDIRLPLSLDIIPFPYEDLEVFDHKIIYYESSRGCPFSCSYCLSSIERKVRKKSIDLVKKDIAYFLDNKIPQVKFVDRTFNCDKKHAMELWSFIKEKDNGITNFHFEISADLLSEEEIQLLSTLRPGQVQFEIGVQSTNKDTVKAIRRNMDFDRLAHNVLQIQKCNNVHLHLDLIAGLPYENYESFANSFNQVYELYPEQLQLGFLKVLKGALMEKESKEYGIITKSAPPYEVLKTKWLSYDEVLMLKGVCEMVEVYYNSGQFQYSMKYLRHFFVTPFELYSALSEFYEKKGYDKIAHSRIRRFEILLEFYTESVLVTKNDVILEDKEVFEEILVLDAFLREDLKSRPKFAKAPMEYGEIRDYCEVKKVDRKKCHVEQFQYHLLETAIQGEIKKGKQIVIFDYSNRDPLTKAASIIL